MKINEILESVKSGKISTSSAKKLLTLYSIEEVENFAKIDINRSKRRGVPEVIFAETKELDDIKKIIKKWKLQNKDEQWKIPLYKIFTDDEDVKLITNIVKRIRRY